MKILDKCIDNNYEDHYIKKKRLKLIFIGLIFIFFILVVRLLYISIYIGKNYSNFQISNVIDLRNRGSIVDRNGIILASDIELVNFYLNRDLISNPAETANIISRIIPEVNAEKLYDKLISSTNKAKYILVKRNITPNQQIEIKNSGIVGFEFNNSLGRIYPHKNLFSHLIGFVDVDRKGIAGLEMQYNESLKKNNNLELTVDIRVQSILRQQLLKALEKYKAKSAIGIISEIKSGDILAIVNLPDFDPNQPSSATKEQLYDKATYGVYEMGSIFKIFTIALGLDKNIISINDQYDVSQVISYGKYEIKQDDYSKKMLTPEEILVRSSNVGAGLIGMKIGTDNMKSFFNLIGMFDRVPTNFPSLAKPLIPQTWRDINTITSSYGHGIAVTPLHIVRAVGGIVNGGIMKTPRFVKGENFEDVKIINENTSKIMNVFLRNVVRKGTGWRANVLGYAVGGKTGSARLLENGEYQEGNIMANFVGIFPMNNPYYLVYIMIESPNDTNMIDISGGTVTAPVFARILENIAPILNVVPYIEKIE